MRDVSYFHLSPRHLKLPTIGPFENTQGGLQRTKHWMWERRVEQHLVLGPWCSQVSVNIITRWVVKFPALWNNCVFLLLFFLLRCGGLMVSALAPRSSGAGASPVRGHVVVFLNKTLNSHSTSLHRGVQMGTGEFNAVGVTLRWTGIPSRGE